MMRSASAIYLLLWLVTVKYVEWFTFCVIKLLCIINSPTNCSIFTLITQPTKRNLLFYQCYLQFNTNQKKSMNYSLEEILVPITASLFYSRDLIGQLSVDLFWINLGNLCITSPLLSPAQGSFGGRKHGWNTSVFWLSQQRNGPYSWVGPELA